MYMMSRPKRISKPMHPIGSQQNCGWNTARPNLSFLALEQQRLGWWIVSARAWRNHAVPTRYLPGGSEAK